MRNSLAYVIPYILKCKPEDRDTLKKIIEDNKYVFRGTPGITCDNQLLRYVLEDDLHCLVD